MDSTQRNLARTQRTERTSRLRGLARSLDGMERGENYTEFQALRDSGRSGSAIQAPSVGGGFGQPVETTADDSADTPQLQSRGASTTGQPKKKRKKDGSVPKPATRKAPSRGREGVSDAGAPSNAADANRGGAAEDSDSEAEAEKGPPDLLLRWEHLHLLDPGTGGANAPLYRKVSTLSAADRSSLQAWWIFFGERSKKDFGLWQKFYQTDIKCCGNKVVSRGADSKWPQEMYACSTCLHKSAGRPCLRLRYLDGDTNEDGFDRIVEVLPKDGGNPSYGYWKDAPPALPSKSA